MKEVYGLQDLMAVGWEGDKNKALFKHSWSTKVLHLDGTVGSRVRTAFLFEQMSESTDLATYITLHKARP